MESFYGSMVSGDPSVLQFNPLWFHDEAQWCQDEFLGHQNEFNGFIMFSKALLKGPSLIQRGASTAPDSTVQERPPQLHVEPAQLRVRLGSRESFCSSLVQVEPKALG